MTNSATEDNDSVLLERLQTLENENRRMKRVGAVVLLGIGALVLMGQGGKNRALDADSIVIRDTSGRVRMELGTSSDTTPILKMFGGSDNKSASVVLTSGKTESGIIFLGPGGRAAVLANGNPPTLGLEDETGGTHVQIATVHTYDHDGFGAFLGRTETVNPKTGSSTKTSAGAITLIGKDGKVVWEAP